MHVYMVVRIGSCVVLACRYVKGTWSQCNSHNEMIRTDTLKDPSTENSNCEKTRQITKKCKSKGRGNKGNYIIIALTGQY